MTRVCVRADTVVFIAVRMVVAVTVLVEAAGPARTVTHAAHVTVAIVTLLMMRQTMAMTEMMKS